MQREQLRAGAALDRDAVQRVDRRLAPLLGRALVNPLRRAAELLEDDEPARAIAALAQHARDLARTGRARRVDD